MVARAGRRVADPNQETGQRLPRPRAGQNRCKSARFGYRFAFHS
jgi:hypothetical protein